MPLQGQFDVVELGGNLSPQGALAGCLVPFEFQISLTGYPGDPAPSEGSRQVEVGGFLSSEFVGQPSGSQKRWLIFTSGSTPAPQKPVSRRPTFESIAVLKTISTDYLAKDQARLERDWLSQHRRDYPGQWIALQGDRLVAHSAVAGEVFRAVRESGVKALVVHIGDEDLPFAGW